MTVVRASGGRPSLRTLQRWMADVICHPDTAEVAVGSRRVRERIPLDDVRHGRIVLPGAATSPTDRLQVYNGAYLARLEECMAADYPALQHLLGPERFHRAVAGYVVRHPSRHPNLNRFGKALPGYLARCHAVSHRAFAVDLARLELAVSLAFDAPAFTPATIDELQAVPAGRWRRTRLVLNPSVQLLALRHPVNDYYQEFKAGSSPRVPRRAAAYVLVCRSEGAVWRLSLSPRAHAVLAALAEGDALGAALAHAGDDPAVGQWFREWAGLQVFAGTRTRRGAMRTP
ncbi:MAG: DNA-binding domain-containing protein [Planctomycetota bacterium]